ncbi:putative holin-like toxin [Priestia megaterium]
MIPINETLMVLFAGGTFLLALLKFIKDDNNSSSNKEK